MRGQERCGNTVAGRALLPDWVGMGAWVLLGLFVQGLAQADERVSPQELRLVPKAHCGPKDRTESVQGETTLAERFAPGEPRAYNCNLELIGQYTGEGSSIGMNVYENTAYVTTWRNPDTKHPGVTVIDVSDSRHPKVSGYLTSPGMIEANESLAISKSRKLLLAAGWSNSTFDLYDLAADPAHPALLSSTVIPTAMSHMGEFSPDGRAFFGALLPTVPKPAPAASPSGVVVIDVSDAAHPRVSATWVPENKVWQTHGARLSEDGTRAYVALTRDRDDLMKAANPNGLVILDISDFQAHRPNPGFRVVGTLFWDDTHFSQDATPYRINGRPYVVFTDLIGALGWQSFPPPVNACDSGKPGRGYARIIDIGDENQPKTASRLMLEVSSPAQCAKSRLDPVVGYGYGSTACDVDDPGNARLLTCTYWEGGLRVFDVRDPYHPAELAYYKPPAVHTVHRAAPPRLDFLPGAKDHTADQVMVPKFRKHGREIWFNSWDNGFQVLRFTDAFVGSHPDLFPN
jgi:hypothetical protein